MTLPGRALLFAFLLPVSLCSEGFAQELYLGNTVVTAGDAPTVGSVGLLAGTGETGQLSRLLSTPLPPLSQHPALIPARDLRQELSQSIDSSFVLVGGPIIYLPKSVTRAADKLFYTSLLQEIERALPERSLRVEVWSPGGQEPDLSGLNGSLQFELPAGTSSPTALISNDYVEYRGAEDKVYRYLPIHIRIDELVPVALRDIPYGTEFSSAAIGYEVRPLSSLSGTPAKLSGQRFQSKAEIARRAVIYSDMVGKVQAIKAGQQVRISFRRGNVAVTVPGSAYQSGALGDTISVAPASTGRRFEATIVSPTEVVVDD